MDDDATAGLGEKIQNRIRMMKLLLLGPVTNADKGLIGGATISFGNLVNYFSTADVSLEVINTKRYFGTLSGLRNVFSIFFRLCQWVPQSDVLFLNSSKGGTKYLAPLIFIFAKIFRAKFVFRPFGGDIKEYTEDYPAFSKWIFRKTTLKANILYLQTNTLMAHYKHQGANVLQLPTSRRKPDRIKPKSRSFSKKFIYLGFVNTEKGIAHLIEAAEILGDEYTVHIYGPIKDELFNKLNEKYYRGVLLKDEVQDTLQEYDVLVLPTYYEGEGYPGAIIESYALGLPVITTKWRSIPEIVEDGVTGILIEPHSTEELISAMKSIDIENYKTYSDNALHYFNEFFDEEQILAKVEKELKSLLKNK